MHLVIDGNDNADIHDTSHLLQLPPIHNRLKMTQ
jgi:hypothetical protein